jgi:hypothetical protein
MSSQSVAPSVLRPSTGSRSSMRRVSKPRISNSSLAVFCQLLFVCAAKDTKVSNSRSERFTAALRLNHQFRLATSKLPMPFRTQHVAIMQRTEIPVIVVGTRRAIWQKPIRPSTNLSGCSPHDRWMIACSSTRCCYECHPYSNR